MIRANVIGLSSMAVAVEASLSSRPGVLPADNVKPVCGNLDRRRPEKNNE